MEFYDQVGLQVELLRSIDDCDGGLTTVHVTPLVGGLPMVGGFAEARVDASGRVVEAGGSLARLSPIGDVELAPATEVLRRLAQGPGQMNWNCRADCTVRTAEARLALAPATNGGFGGHDHTPGGVVEAPASHVLVPAVVAPGDGSGHPDNNLPDVSYSAVLAISSAVMVDDPAQAEAARRADATSTVPPASGPACAGQPEAFPVIAVCTSQPHPTAGVPVLLTANGERFEPVGADGCKPLFSLDPGDGSGPQSFLPRSGTLITARVAHTYTAPGTYDVVVREASRCSTPAPGGGTEPEYDQSAHITLTVTE
jgi:hypothetical protein